MPTGSVQPGSVLERKRWVREGLVQGRKKSFWTPFIGRSSNNVIHQVNNSNASEGHNVVFDYNGELNGKPVKGKTTAYGKGEQKKKFSDVLTVDRYRFVVDNGDAFDAQNIGDLSLTRHSQSRTLLSDLFHKNKDQMFFDIAQGNFQPVTNNLVRQTNSHSFDLGNTFDWNTLIDIERNIRTSTGYAVGKNSKRRPLPAYTTSEGRDMWLYIIDASMAAKLRQDTDGYQNIIKSADFRGEKNHLIKGVIGTLGCLMIIEAPNFFGETEDTASGWGFNDSSVEIAGLRQYNGAANSGSAVWTGDEGFDPAAASLRSRGLLVGKNAIKFAMGKEPDYKVQRSQDFGITSESCLEVWMDAKKSFLKAENDEYKAAKITGHDFGIITTELAYN